MSSLEPTSRLGKRPALDGLRAVAVMGVLLAHFGWYIGGGGFLGVDVFFVLSGFLITRMLVEEHADSGRIYLGAFYARRAFRLFPALILTVLALGLFYGTFYKSVGDWWREAWLSLTYLMDIGRAISYLPNEEAGPLGVTWSLAIEEHFYLIWPLVLIWLLRRRPVEWVGALAAALAVASYGIILVSLAAGVDLDRLYFRPDARSGALLLGCAAAMLGHKLTLPVLRGLFLPCAALLPILLQWAPGNAEKGSYLWAIPLTWLVTCVLILGLVALSGTAVHWLLELPPVVYIGRISYGIYLAHLPIIIVLYDRGLPFSVRALGSVLLPIALAALSFHLVESRLSTYGRTRFARRVAVREVAPL
jgi:peptidoglycan/LPS O-acetylase OafA/YrhL